MERHFGTPWQRRWLPALTLGLLLPLLLLFGVASAADQPAASDVPTPLNVADHGGEGAIYGIIDVMLDPGLEGNWVVGGVTYAVTSQTTFKAEHGPFAVGACVRIDLVEGTSDTVREIETQEMSDCDGNGDDHEGDGEKFYGIVESMPLSGTVGEWVISGNPYTATLETELEAEHGIFEVGSCVKVELVAGTGNVIKEMETERAYHCNGGDDDDDDDDKPSVPVIGKGEMFGELQSFPDGFMGEWQIGTLTFTVDAKTELEPKNGPFEVGALVKVEFWILVDGTFLAREIKTAVTPDFDDDDDHKEKHKGHAFGLIEQLPEGGLTGVWVIGGTPYTATAETDFHNDSGNFEVGKRVKVKFFLDAAGGRVATHIKIAGKGGDVGQGNDYAKLLGYVETMPEGTFLGTWIVSSVEFSATATSKFEEEHGLLAVGAYVKVEYTVQDGVRIIHKVETKVPPGGGEHNFAGKIEHMDDSSLSAAGVDADTTWVVGGRTFVVTDATSINGNFSTSDTVAVNSYQAADGSQVATRISSISLDNAVFLPITVR